MEKTVRTQVLLPQRLVADLKQIAKKEKTSKSDIIRRAAASYIQRTKRPLSALPEIHLGGRPPLTRKELYGSRSR
jgi:predicted transcriptional regulator